MDVIAVVGTADALVLVMRDGRAVGKWNRATEMMRCALMP